MLKLPPLLTEVHRKSHQMTVNDDGVGFDVQKLPLASEKR
jgi:hypothetical protein